MSKRADKYRLYPGAPKEGALETMLRAFRDLYNAGLQQRIEAWRRHRIALRYLDLAKELKALRVVDDRLTGFSYSAKQQVLRRLTRGEKPGVPRFQSKRRAHSAEIWFGDGLMLRTSGRLGCTGVPGEINVKWHRDFPEGDQTGTAVFSRNAGKGCVAFQLSLPSEAPEQPNRPAVGLSSLVATSAGRDFGGAALGAGGARQDPPAAAPAQSLSAQQPAPARGQARARPAPCRRRSSPTPPKKRRERRRYRLGRHCGPEHPATGSPHLQAKGLGRAIEYQVSRVPHRLSEKPAPSGDGRRAFLSIPDAGAISIKEDLMSVRLRQVFVALRLRWFGRIAPREIVRAFGVSRATASAEVSALRACVPGARHDGDDKATVADPDQAARLAGKVAPTGRSALEMLFAQKRLVEAGVGMELWSQIPLEDRVSPQDPIDNDVVRVVFAAIEDGGTLDLKGRGVPGTITPCGLVRARGQFRVRAVDHADGGIVEVDFADIRAARPSRAAPLIGDADPAPQALEDWLMLFADTTITVSSQTDERSTAPEVSTVCDQPCLGAGSQIRTEGP